MHLALQFVKRPNLTKEQKDLILEGISLITPDAYDRENPEKWEKTQQDWRLIDQKIRTLFSKQENFEIFVNYSGGTTEINFLRKYLDISALSEHDRMNALQISSANDKSDLWRARLVYILQSCRGLIASRWSLSWSLLPF